MITSVNAQEVVKRILTLKEVLQIAEESDIHLILSQERLVQALARVEQNKSVLLPQISVSSSERRQTRDLRSSGISFSGDPLVGPFNSFDIRAQMTQTLFDASTISRLKAAQAGKELSAAELKKTKEDVLALIATMFVNARRSKESLTYRLLTNPYLSCHYANSADPNKRHSYERVQELLNNARQILENFHNANNTY